MISVAVSGRPTSIAARSAVTSIVAADGGATVEVAATATAVTTVTSPRTGVEVVGLADLLGIAVTTPTMVVDQVGGAVTLPVDKANTFAVALTSDLSSIVWSGRRTDARSQRVTLYIRQGGAGGHALSLPQGAVLWTDGQPPLSTRPDALDCIVFDLVDGDVIGNLVGLDYL